MHSNCLRCAPLKLVRLASLVGLILNTSFAAATAPEVSCKRVFDATLFRGKPDLRKFGLGKAIVTDPLRWWDAKESRSEMTKGHGPEDWVATVVPGDILALDNESWPTVGSAESVSKTVKMLGETVTRLRAAGFTKPIGYYGIPPNRDYWRAIKGPADREYAKWHAENELLAPLVDYVDALFPSLYTFYDDLEGWKTYASANIAEARKVSRGKPIYAFLWPQFHESNKKIGGQYIPAEFWAAELKVALESADGIVIWGGWQQQWDELAPWWVATKTMLATQTLCESVVAPKKPEDLQAN